MKIEFIDKRMESILNHQFKIAGIDMDFGRMKEIIEEGKKKTPWYEYYLFDNKQQYEDWKEWAQSEMRKRNISEDFDKVDLLYGLNFKMKPTLKEGQLEMF